MAVKDWSATAGSNSTVGGVNIAEGAPRANMNNMGRAIMAEAKVEFASLGVSLDGFGAVGDGVTNDKPAFDAFRTYVQATASTATITLNLTPGKTYASTDPGWLLALGRKIIVNGNGARFLNIVSGAASFVDQVPLWIGGLGYIDAVSSLFTAKGMAVNTTSNYLINTVARGSATITTTTAADAGNFTAGDWVLICSDLAYVGGSPPSMHNFQYAQVLTAVAGTGVITLDATTTRNAYSATRDNTLVSGAFTSRARVFKLHSTFDCDITVNDLVVLPSTNYSSYAAYAVGRKVLLRGGQYPGITLTITDDFRAENVTFDCTADFEPIDKLVASAQFENCRFTGANIGGDGAGGTITFQGGSIDGRVAVWPNSSFDGVKFGGSNVSGAGVTLFRAENVRFINCTGPGNIVATESDVAMTVDGATITSTATTIIVPRAGITSGSTLGQFIQRLKVGCRIDEYSTTDTSGFRNGKFCRVTSITDSGANLVIGVNYSGGTSIANGTIFRAPCMLSFEASGNIGGGVLINSANIQSTTGIPNGSLATIRGNVRRLLIDPVSGDSYGNATFPVNGIPKRFSARVHRVYSGVTHATLGLEILAVQPTAAQLARVDLKTLGGRESTRVGASPALGADTWTTLATTYTGRLNVVINVAAAGAAAALGETTEKLPVIELLLEFEDIAHDAPFGG